MGRFNFNIEKEETYKAQEANKCVANIQQCKEYHINNSTIKIIFGNILDSQVEVIVSSDDCHITMGGGVSMAIKRKEGTGAIMLDAKKNIPAEIGDVVVSTAGTSIEAASVSEAKNKFMATHLPTSTGTYKILSCVKK